jgi:enoyl-CoA hydratase/carnithine racemase
MAPPELHTLRYDVRDAIATITLHRPDKMNAFTAQMRDDLIAGVRRRPMPTTRCAW